MTFPIFVSAVLHVVWVVAAFFALMSWRRLRAIGEAPTLPIAGARPGMEGRFQGRTAFDGAPHTSPLGARQAVWFDWLVEQDRFTQRGGPPAVAADRSMEMFAIVDAAGYRMLISPVKAEILGLREARWDNEYPSTIDGALRERLQRGVDLAEPLSDAGRLHFTERWLAAGEPCFVMGRVEAPGPEDGPDVRGLIREGGERDFLISAGAPVDAQAALRRQAIYGAIVAPVALALAVLAMVLA